MTKSLTLLALAGALALASCKGRDHGHVPGTDSSYIPVDSANKMIGSYITSLSSPGSELHSISINAEALRDYLNSEEGSEAVDVKIMFAHTLQYINTGHKGQPCGYNSGQLTLVIAGYDASGKFRLAPFGTAVDFGQPCPSNCPNGQAAGDLLPTKGASPHP